MMITDGTIALLPVAAYMYTGRPPYRPIHYQRFTAARKKNRKIKEKNGL